MPVSDYGTTRFDHDQDFTGKVKITTAEGSAIAVPVEDIMKFASGYARWLRVVRLDQMSWQDVLEGK